MDLKKPLYTENSSWLQRNRARQNFASIRCGTAPLRIETGRFENMNIEEQVCQICNTDIIEDEMHFIMWRNAHQQSRHKLLIVAEHTIEGFSRLSLEDKFEILMTNPPLCSVTARACHNMLSVLDSACQQTELILIFWLWIICVPLL